MINTDRLPADVGADELPYYRSRTVGLLRYYFQIALDTGRMPNLLGREIIFEARMSYRRRFTFEDACLFVHDMQSCLFALDAVDRKLLTYFTLHDYDLNQTAAEMLLTHQAVRRRFPLAVDALTRILLDRDLLVPLPAEEARKKAKKRVPNTVDIQACADEAFYLALNGVLFLHAAVLCATDLVLPFLRLRS